MFRRSSGKKDLPAWSRDEIRNSVLAIYQVFEAKGGRQHYRTAFLLHYNLRLMPSDAAKAYQEEGRDALRFLVYSIEVGAEDRPNSVGIGSHGSLEAARTECVNWVGQPREVDWSALSQMTTTGFFNAVREPGIAEFDDSFGREGL
jgi:hypothetical protein